MRQCVATAIPKRLMLAHPALCRHRRDKLVVVAAREPEGDLPAKVPPTGLLIGLYLPNSLADAVALGLSESGQLGWSLISATDDRSRRIADVADRGLGRLS